MIQASERATTRVAPTILHGVPAGYFRGGTAATAVHGPRKDNQVLCFQSDSWISLPIASRSPLFSITWLDIPPFLALRGGWELLRAYQCSQSASGFSERTFGPFLEP